MSTVDVRLVAALMALAQTGQCTTYGALAEALQIAGPGRIRRLTAMLETLMEEDAAEGRPLRAALVLGRASDGLPARGFFVKAHELGLCPEDMPHFSAREFHLAQLELLFAAL